MTVSPYGDGPYGLNDPLTLSGQNGTWWSACGEHRRMRYFVGVICGGVLVRFDNMAAMAAMIKALGFAVLTAASSTAGVRRWLLAGCSEDPGQDIGQPGLRIDLVHLGSDDQTVHHCRPLPAAVETREQP
jgi:hypothetical protein